MPFVHVSPMPSTFSENSVICCIELSGLYIKVHIFMKVLGCLKNVERL